jgi:hypothetical protein
MERPNPQSQPNRRLRKLLREADITSFRIDATQLGVSYTGRVRDWLIAVRLNEHWFNAYTRVCDLPAEVGLRARLLDYAMDANRRMSLTKLISSSGGLLLEIDYRAEHVGSAEVGNLIGLLHHNAESYYPRVFRIVSGDETLEALESQLRPSGEA